MSNIEGNQNDGIPKETQNATVQSSSFVLGY
jgi:hypothetical protein